MLPAPVAQAEEQRAQTSYRWVVERAGHGAKKRSEIFEGRQGTEPRFTRRLTGPHCCFVCTYGAGFDACLASLRGSFFEAELVVQVLFAFFPRSAQPGVSCDRFHAEVAAGFSAISPLLEADDQPCEAG